MNLHSVMVAFIATFIAAAPAAAQPQQPIQVEVLPFADPDTHETEFPDALTDEIAFALTKVSGLGVVERSSVYVLRLPGQVIYPDPILNADYAVSGTAHRMGQSVLITASLDRLDGGATPPLWQAEYDKAFSDLFDIEEDIALHVAAALDHPANLAGGEHLLNSRAKDMDAYDQYLRAKVAARGRGAQALAEAVKLLEPALARDPDFEPAAAMIAYDYALTPLFASALRGGHSDEEREITDRLIPRAEAFALRAVALDPTDAAAFVALGYVRLAQRNMIAAEDAFKQALMLDPNEADGLHGYSQFLAAMGRIDESLAMRAHLQEIEAAVINYTADTAEIEWLAGNTDKAIEMLQPFRPGRTLELSLIEAASGRYRDAAAALREMPPATWPDGLLAKAAQLLDAAPANLAADSLPKLGSLGFVYLHVGAPERVLEYYEDEVKGGYFQPISATWFWHPSYEAVRKSVRFKKLTTDLGMVDYWRARGWPQWCHPVGTDDFACD